MDTITDRHLLGVKWSESPDVDCGYKLALGPRLRWHFLLVTIF